MKFNTELLQTTLPEWRLYFLNYAVLKRLIQHILASERAEASGTPQEPDWSSSDDEQAKRKGKQVLPGSVPRQQFWTTLDKELEKIQKFYSLKIQWADKQLEYLEAAVETLEDSCRKDTKLSSPRLLVMQDTLTGNNNNVSSSSSSSTTSTNEKKIQTTTTTIPISSTVAIDRLSPFSPSHQDMTPGLTLGDITGSVSVVPSSSFSSTIHNVITSSPSSGLPPLVPSYRNRDGSSSGTDSLINSIRNSPTHDHAEEEIRHSQHESSTTDPILSASHKKFPPISSTVEEPFSSDREFSPSQQLRESYDMLHLDDNESILSCSASRLASPSLMASPGRASIGHILDQDTLSLDQGQNHNNIRDMYPNHTQPILSASSSFTNLSAKDSPLEEHVLKNSIHRRSRHRHSNIASPSHPREHHHRHHHHHHHHEELGGSDTPGLYGDDEGSLVYSDTENDSEVFQRYVLPPHPQSSSLRLRQRQRTSSGLSEGNYNNSPLRTHNGKATMTNDFPPSVHSHAVVSPNDDDRLSTITGITSLLNSGVSGGGPSLLSSSSSNYSLSKRYSSSMYYSNNNDRTASTPPFDTPSQKILQSHYRAFFTEHGTAAVDNSTAQQNSTSTTNTVVLSEHQHMYNNSNVFTSTSSTSTIHPPPISVPSTLSSSSFSPPPSPMNHSTVPLSISSPQNSGGSLLLNNMVSMGDYVRLRKQASDLVTELHLLAEYLRLNDTAVYKIVKKFDKNTNEKNMASFLERLHAPESFYVFLLGQPVAVLRRRANTIIDRLRRLQPDAKMWSKINVYTIGTFDLMHHGHVNLLQSMRIFGANVIAGIHDDVSYQLLKGQPPVDTLAVRMNNIRPYCDTIFVIPSTDPTPYIQGAIRPSDLELKRCVYVRGDDMPNFPGRLWLEDQGIPIYLLPRTEGVSSSFVRAVYHNPKLNESITSPLQNPPLTPGNGTNLTRSTSDIPAWEDRSTRKALLVAFSKLDDVGKPILENK